MDTSYLKRISDYEWHLPRSGKMRVPAVLFASKTLLDEMEDKVLEQLVNVACLPGIVEAAYAMPDAHWGYGFPIGGVAAFDPDEGIISAGGVGFDISCGVRTLLTGLRRPEIEKVKNLLADALFEMIPAGVGSTGKITLDPAQMDAMLHGGARWAVEQGFGFQRDLDHLEERGQVNGALPSAVSKQAKKRQYDEMGTLGSGNHYLEVQEVAEVHDESVAAAFGLKHGDIVVSIHCGSRGLGHQIGTEYLREMALAAEAQGIKLPDLELACARLNSDVGKRYLGAMRAGINCALANRQILTHLTRKVFSQFFEGIRLDVLYDVSHNTCKEEIHEVSGKKQRLFIHRKGATRAFGAGHKELPPSLTSVGQPVFIGGSMGTASAIMAGSNVKPERAFASACHGAGRSMSRHQALKRWKGKQVIQELEQRGILVRSPSTRGVAEEAPGAYKDISAVVDATHAAGLARKVATLQPLICIKG